MTLVAGLSVGGSPAFMGDLMTSWRLRSLVDLPTRAASNEQPVGQGYYAAGLAQKLIVVRPYLLLAWAGVEAEVRRLALELDECLPENLSDLHTPEPAMRILDTCSEGTELVALLIWGKTIQPLCIRTRGFELDGRRVYALGSGTPSFLRHLEEGTLQLPPDEGQDSVVARASLLRFAARAFGMQWVAGVGLEEAWGGGFEVAYPDTDGFRKVDNILYRAWIIDPDGGYRHSGRSYFIRYYGRAMHLSCFGPDEMTYIVDSPVGPQRTPPAKQTVHPEWMVDSFLVAKVGSFAEVARYQPPRRPPIDSLSLTFGAVTGWHMDQRYVEGCVRSILSQVEAGKEVAHWHKY